MQLNIKYFGLLAELTETNEEQIQFSGSIISEVLDLLFLKYPELKHKDFKVALNQEIVSMETFVSNEDIALLPPFSGG